MGEASMARGHPIEEPAAEAAGWDDEWEGIEHTEEFKQLVRDIALHIASARPRWLTREDVPPEELEQEKKIYEAWAREQGRPEQALAKIVEGKLHAFYKDNVLADQPFVKDDSKTIAELVDEVAAKVGEKVAIRRFDRYELGEELG